MIFRLDAENELLKTQLIEKKIPHEKMVDDKVNFQN